MGSYPTWEIVMSDESTEEVVDYSDQEAEELLADAVSADKGDDGEHGESTETKDPEKELAKWRALARKHEASAKENSAAAQKLREIEDAKKSAEEKLNEQLTAAQLELTEYKVAQVRREAAESAGLPAALATYIRATDPDEAREQAKELAQWRDSESGSRTDLKQGARPVAKKQPTMDDWLRNEVSQSRH